MRYDLPYGNFPGIWTNPCEREPEPFMPIDPPLHCEAQHACQEHKTTRRDRQDPACGRNDPPAPCTQVERRFEAPFCPPEDTAYEDRPCKTEKYCKQTPGMVYHAPHDGARMYEPMQAFRRGTLYEELDKPMKLCNDQCTRVHCTREQVEAFTLWELRLYLNTHSHDQAALHLFEKLCRECGAMHYACAFLPNLQRNWAWVWDPWPWEYAANCDGRGKN